MLMAEAFVKLTEIAQTQLPGSIVSIKVVEERVAQALVQYSIRTLQTQNSDGSWGNVGPREETGYAVLGLASVTQLAIVRPFRAQIIEAISKGRQFLLLADLDGPPEHLWVEKVLYGSSVLSAAYTLAALRVDVSETSKLSAGDPLTTTAVAKPDKSLMLFKQLPVFKDCLYWILTASQVEAQTFMSALKRIRRTIFTRQGLTDDKYFAWIPQIWTTANNLFGGRIAPAAMFDMMALSIVNFQVDEFMESTVALEFAEYHSEIISWLRSRTRCGYEPLEEHVTSKGDHEGTNINGSNNNQKRSPSFTLRPSLDIPGAERVTEPLSAFLDFVTSHSQVRISSQHDRKKLMTRIVEFLTAHLVQNEDNANFGQQKKKRRYDETDARNPEVFVKVRTDFHTWVRGTAADHTSCSYSFAYAACIFGKRGQDFFPNLSQKYIAEDLCRHLATMCRLYNDAGSLSRDQAEWNLNSANFPELHSVDTAAPRSRQTNKSFKQRLLDLASYERTMLGTTWEQLKSISNKDVVDMLTIFITVTDIFGEIYVLKDLASRKLPDVHADNANKKQKI